VCIPTPLMPKALAAVLIARSALLGSTAVPLSVVKTRPADSALERPRTKDVRRATSPCDAPGERCGRGIRELGPPGSSGDRAWRGRSADVPLSVTIELGGRGPVCDRRLPFLRNGPRQSVTPG
jgi:hypothetical protein